MTPNTQNLLSALMHAEAVLSDIGDAEREPGDDLAWCEQHAAKALPVVRRAIAAYIDDHDTEPATVEWIEAEFPQLKDSGFYNNRRYELCSQVRILAGACPGGFMPCVLWTRQGDESIATSRPITRGEVRRLVSVLKGAE